MEQSLKPIIEQLEVLFSKFNERFYNGELQTPIIAVSPDTTKGAFGWCTGWRAWGTEKPKLLPLMTPEEVEAAKNDGYYEINLCAEHLSRPFSEIAETLLHEMAHLYNIQIGVQDTSRGGFYHNKNYKKAAEAHGLTVEKTPKYGYSETALNDESKEFIKQFDNTEFSLYRRKSFDLGAGTTKAKKSNARKYVCPGCGSIIRATKEVNVICGDCYMDFELEEA